MSAPDGGETLGAATQIDAVFRKKSLRFEPVLFLKRRKIVVLLREDERSFRPHLKKVWMLLIYGEGGGVPA